MDHPSLDLDLRRRIEELKASIKQWAEDRYLWFDSKFTTWVEHVQDEPQGDPCVLILCGDGPLQQVFCEYDSTFDEFLELVGPDFRFEVGQWNDVMFYVNDEQLKARYLALVEWEWVCSLIQPDYSDLHEEIYEQFVGRPEGLHQLEPRKLEILIDGVFRNQGYRSQLGPGSGDGGVDLKLFHKDEIGDVTTLVQIKRYAKNRPIALEAVSALSMVVEDQRANRGLFVTTSRYLPSAQKFAKRMNSRLVLATSVEVIDWCKKASNNIVRDKANLVTDEHILKLLGSPQSSGLEGKVVHGTWGYNMTINDFCLVLKETRGAALLIHLPTRIVDHDHGQVGHEIPILDPSILANRNQENVFRASKSAGEFRNYLWGRQRTYSVWDGQPQYFNYMD